MTNIKVVYETSPHSHEIISEGNVSKRIRKCRHDSQFSEGQEQFLESVERLDTSEVEVKKSVAELNEKMDNLSDKLSQKNHLLQQTRSTLLQLKGATRTAANQNFLIDSVVHSLRKVVAGLNTKNADGK